MKLTSEEINKVGTLTSSWNRLTIDAEEFKFDYEYFKETAKETYPLLYKCLHDTDSVPKMVVVMMKEIQRFSECVSGGIGKEYAAAQVVAEALADPMHFTWDIENIFDDDKPPRYMQVNLGYGLPLVYVDSFDLLDLIEAME